MIEAPRAIETRYNGYRFRSRLEARWAVFFDAMGLAFEYEKEGFVLDNGLCYLPDFWLPSIDSWIEVKGDWTAVPGDETWRKAVGLARDTGQCVNVCVGQFTDPDSLIALQFAGIEDDVTGFAPTRVWWFVCPVCQRWQLGKNVLELSCLCLYYAPAQQPALLAAVDQAKSARFEFHERD